MRFRRKLGNWKKSNAHFIALGKVELFHGGEYLGIALEKISRLGWAQRKKKRNLDLREVPWELKKSHLKQPSLPHKRIHTEGYREEN